MTDQPPNSEATTSEKISAGAQGASDIITERLGLERIEGFSLKSFFADTFRKHAPDEMEVLLSVGAPTTTPKLHPAMGQLPAPWIFFRVLVGALATYGIFFCAWNAFANVNLIPGLIVAGSFAVPFAVLILFFELNTPRNVSLPRVIQLLTIGGALSLLLSLILFDVAPFLGVFGASAAGIVEETGKLAAVLFAFRFVQMKRYPYRLNALLFGAAVGTGFAAFESSGYALRIGFRSAEAMLDNITIRGVLSPFGHIVWTAIAASAYWIARHQNPDLVSTIKSRKFLALFAAPVVLHFIWNLPFEGPFMAKYWILGFVAWVIIISLIQTGLKEVASMAQGETQ